jgi:Transglutaminase-like superfamily
VSSSFTAGANLARKLRKAWRLPVRDWMVLTEAALCFPAVELTLRLMPLRRLLTLCEWGSRPDGSPMGVSPERVSCLVEAAAGAYPFRATCLKKALVLYALLTRRGLSARLLLGTAKENGNFRAHAWVEHGGKVVLGGQEDSRYLLLCSLDSPWVARGLKADVTR